MSTRADKLSVSLTADLAEWLRQQADFKGSNISQVIREHLLPHYRRDQRSGKNDNDTSRNRRPRSKELQPAG
jgi:hypothetical protein